MGDFGVWELEDAGEGLEVEVMGVSWASREL